MVANTPVIAPVFVIRTMPTDVVAWGKLGEEFVRALKLGDLHPRFPAAFIAGVTKGLEETA